MKKFIRTASSVALAGGLALAGAGTASADENVNMDEIRQQYSQILYEYYYYNA